MLVLENDAKATGGVRQAPIYEILQKDMVLEKGCVGLVLGILGYFSLFWESFSFKII